MDTFDCVVVGGGMVGGAAALSLAQLGLKVAVIEKVQPKAFSSTAAFDLRVSAISLGSEQLLGGLGVWQNITEMRVCPYRRLGVWEIDNIYTEFNATEIRQSHLGHIVENHLIQLALWQKLEALENVTLLCPETVKNIEQSDEQARLTLGNSTIHAKLVLAADGANSFVRQLVGIGLTGWDYQQNAMLINVKTEAEQQDITWQKFTSEGPLAMLPMPGKHASLVWYHAKQDSKRIQSFSNEQLDEQVSAIFPERLGKVTVVDKGTFPLTRRHANSYQAGRVLLLGDAAHTINPLAGQGVNLGFKDVKALRDVIETAINDGLCWHDVEQLSGYEKLRRKDNLLMMSAMDMFYAGFSNDLPLPKFIRNAGLFIANKAPILKSKALEYACGLK